MEFPESAGGVKIIVPTGSKRSCRCRIPEPVAPENFPGKFLVRMTRSLHRDLARRAESEGVSLNQFVVSKLAAICDSATTGIHITGTNGHFRTADRPGPSRRAYAIAKQTKSPWQLHSFLRTRNDAPEAAFRAGNRQPAVEKLGYMGARW
jgi:hypothetical protein